MEMLVKKYQQKYKKVGGEMDQWDQLQSRLIDQYKSACVIMKRLPLLQKNRKYGVLNCIDGIKEAVPENQMISLEKVFHSMRVTMEEFRSIVVSLEKILRDGRQLVEGGGTPLTKNQMQMQVGILPRIDQCVEGLQLLHEMHRDEYRLKVSIVSKLMEMKPLTLTATDMDVLGRLLVDQPNIPKEEGTR
ncbi:hypothetical protein GIB67_043117 [Kingdonia uniflora]|uniref:Uncharacterized protein n=1 Tax=Kingdonia uniflora TaxID=39325 RepID=A0A7J7NJB5_9MAGN|nr:hypothetical protein GIB67_043117 [Kingdonia uniflora]